MLRFFKKSNKSINNASFIGFAAVVMIAFIVPVAIIILGIVSLFLYLF